MSIFSSYKKIFLLGFIVAILIAIPFSVYIAQKRQQIKSKAAASTTLSFNPSSPTITANQTLSLDVVLDPGSGATANQVSFVKLVISFDPSKFTTVSDSLALNPNSPNTLTSVLEDSVYTSGTASISLSIGADPTKVLTTKAKIAVLKLKALSQTESNNPSSITFDKTTQVLSIAASDQTSENVLSTTTPAIVTIASASTSTTPTSTNSFAPATSTPTPTPLAASFPQSSPLSQGGTTNLSTGSAVFNPTPVFETEPSPIVLLPQESLPPVGPGEKILVIGAIGAILTLIGGALFILL